MIRSGKAVPEGKKLQIDKLSSLYQVRRLDTNDVDSVFELCSKNIIYYQYCPPFITKQGVMEDMVALPSGKNKEDKYFLGYFEAGILIAVLDLISGYSSEDTAYIGLFMMNGSKQGQGIGTLIIDELCKYLKLSGYQRVELAWVKGNQQAAGFWIKNHFRIIGERKSNAADHVIAAERKI